MRTSKATATWHGILREGNGRFTAGSGTFEAPYSFATRFADARGTNPEELIAAAHAACLSMALSASLEKAGTPATWVTTEASCQMDTVDGAPEITTMQLGVRGKVDNLDQAGFATAAAASAENCPVSKALRGNVNVVVEAVLEQ
jgi:osmotically inducible protein OsmC